MDQEADRANKRALYKKTKFWDRLAERYSRIPVSDEESYQHKLEYTRRFFSPDTKVFEFGCGTGSTSIAHAPFVSHIDATDISANMIAICKRKAEAAGISNVTFRQADVDELEIPEGSYDVVMGHSILHLVADKEAVIAKAHRMLKPDGVFVTSTACVGDSWVRFLKFLVPIGRFLNLLPLITVFTRDELVQSIADAGFDIDYNWKPSKSAAVFVVAKKMV